MTRKILSLCLLAAGILVSAQTSACPVPYEELCFVAGHQPAFILKFKQAVKQDEVEKSISQLMFPGVKFDTALSSNSDGSFMLKYKLVGSHGEEMPCYSQRMMRNVISYLKEHIKDVTAIRQGNAKVVPPVY